MQELADLVAARPTFLNLLLRMPGGGFLGINGDITGGGERSLGLIAVQDLEFCPKANALRDEPLLPLDGKIRCSMLDASIKANALVDPRYFHFGFMLPSGSRIL